MTENNRNETAADENAVDRAEDVRKTRSIRFSDSEWEEVKRAALAHDIPAAEFVRERILTLARNPESAGSGPVPPSMAPLIERMFRYTWFLATERRDAMLREGRQKGARRAGRGGPGVPGIAARGRSGLSRPGARTGASRPHIPKSRALRTCFVDGQGMPVVPPRPQHAHVARVSLVFRSGHPRVSRHDRRRRAGTGR